MSQNNILDFFDLTGKTAVITGGGGVLCGSISRMLARLGVKVAVLDLSIQAAENITSQIQSEGGEAMAVPCDVLDKESIISAELQITEKYGHVDFLINGAGGNKAQATTGIENTFFDIPPDAIQWVFNLNFLGTLLPSQVFGKGMVERQKGIILNISSMNAFRPLTRIPAYSAAKAAVSNFTQWLSVHIAQEYSPEIRVNAIAPGFFLTEQNRFLLTEKDTCLLTARGSTIIDHTPLGRFGKPEDLFGAVLWLLSPSSQFVTGVVVPVDGGFSAFSGV